MRKQLVLAVIALIVASASFLYYQKETLAYNVIINGELVTQVKDLRAWEQALTGYKAEVAEQINGAVQERDEIVLEKTRVRPEMLAKDLGQVIQEEVALTTDAPSLFVDGDRRFSVLSAEDLEGMLEEYKERYTRGIDPAARVQSVEFRQQVEVKTSRVVVDFILTGEQARDVLFKLEEEELQVQVQPGDYLGKIARDHNTTLQDILDLNPLIDAERIKPGDRIVVRRGKPLLDVVVTLTNTVREEIPYETEYRKDASLLSRDRQVLRQGVNGERKVTYRVTLLNGYQHSMETVLEEVIKEPVTRVLKVGTRKTLSRGVNRNFGVVQGTRVSSGFGWRTHPIFGTRKFHAGVDIAAPTGNGVYAYTSGVVSFAGQSGGYGNLIIIDHGGGMETRYAHLSKFYVSTGQKVSAGTKIGAVGSTGDATGPHLHFEVRKGGEPQNPWDYI